MENEVRKVRLLPAARSGFSIGTLYQYFADKEAIIAALAERERDKILSTIVKALSSIEPGDFENVVREIVRTLVGSFAKRRRARKIILMTMLKRWQFTPDKQGVILRFIISELDWEANVDPYFKENHYLEPVPVADTEREGYVDRWIVYGKVDKQQLFTAKELTVDPGVTCTIRDSGGISSPRKPEG